MPGKGFPAEERRGGKREITAGGRAVCEAVAAVEGSHVHARAVPVAGLACGGVPHAVLNLTGRPREKWVAKAHPFAPVAHTHVAAFDHLVGAVRVDGLIEDRVSLGTFPKLAGEARPPIIALAAVCGVGAETATATNRLTRHVARRKRL
eukprot:CAMPEP_0170116438 /NCGR_PEP_ID=MMETSP0020_2-20130122/12266_2 /TAXON_ID=98059 /ORGANISM="Dinobryon sp., Strain UTEXLB2267" /LENGTH=148 /DNA_ID=CAMNT_0010344549 /DNA_START=796 /DNA_END=1242 /DNA_ORIENTATION=-